MSKNVLVTGSGGLIGSEAVKYYASRNDRVVGLDNNMRRSFFGPGGDVNWNIAQLREAFPTNYTHENIDIRDYNAVLELIKKTNPALIIHCAAQPSHDWAANDPITDFSVNAVGTLNMLEATRKTSKDSVFIFTSTNKVYGDTPNSIPVTEYRTRFDVPRDSKDYHGINEHMTIDRSTHSIFGVSKVAADLMVQEYGRYFGMKTGVFRGGCLTGPAHSGVKLHGFLSYLANSIINEKPYEVIGYSGKQVRDNIHSSDLINAFDQFFTNPRPGEVYNIGGSRDASVSVLEAINKIETATGKKARTTFNDTPRVGDHRWYITDVGKFKGHYPSWNYTYTLDQTITDICRAIVDRKSK